MQYNKIVLAGGNGYLGQVLAAHYAPLAKEIVILGRSEKAAQGNIATIVWDGRNEGEWVNSLEGADMLINLCGKNVNCRYTAKNRAEIINSRVVPTQLLGQVIAGLQNPPRLWINVTSATIYRHAEDHAQDEETGQIGYGFSIDVCRQWEAAFFNCSTPATRQVALRMGIVLGRKDGVFPRLLNLVKLGMGGRQGDGQQYVAWVHEQDVAHSTEWLLQHSEISGVVNCTAPVAVKNTDLMQALRKAYGVPIGLPTPAWLLEIGAVVIGTETELILKSRWVAPKRLLDSGYHFRFSEADHAIKDILSLRV
ncbi:TIGR01777 family oxidoreductase [Mucilaginibacter sp. Bleaf8]|uniref:TIGR01777 family oxidoreductase n=1 Tax=Mucilaginibacter sp. Bleaf8 TaxID=2834430 RepID=UPI001BCCEA16|nr:TIGR01777 family oxidoreductase [Mucilaginibacter sp. Bleaf8]MBS7563743.1 TIGR01777 family oxidoreductase [Mucilaginibacter sp. Bleaf8]